MRKFILILLILLFLELSLVLSIPYTTPSGDTLDCTGDGAIVINHGCFHDADGDGFLYETYANPGIPDINDSNPLVYPDAPEYIDAFDNNGNGNYSSFPFWVIYKDLNCDNKNPEACLNEFYKHLSELEELNLSNDEFKTFYDIVSPPIINYYNELTELQCKIISGNHIRTLKSKNI